jgi:hypothetical protein
MSMIKIEKRKNRKSEWNDKFLFTKQIHKENMGII